MKPMDRFTALIHIVHDEYGGEMELFSLHEPEWTQRGAGHPGGGAADGHYSRTNK